MFRNVVVGVDGRQGGRDAIALAGRLAGGGAQCTLVYVHRGEEHPWRGSNAAYDTAERERAQELLSNAADEAGINAQRLSAGATSVGRGLHQKAESVGADLLVVGSSSAGLLDRVLLGDDTQAALNGAPCAVSIAPSGYARESVLMREIGVGYNRSAESDHALAVARALAAEHGAKLSAFEAVALPGYAFMGSPAPIDAPIEEIVQEARDRLLALGGVEAHAAYGHPSEELALYSASLDLLVVGSRDYGPIGRLVHGSTTHQLARTARCPLLVLTRAAREHPSQGSVEDAARPAAVISPI